MGLFGFVRCRDCNKIRQHSWRDDHHCEPCMMVRAFDLWIKSLDRAIQLRTMLVEASAALTVRRMELKYRSLLQIQAVAEIGMRPDMPAKRYEELYALVIRDPFDNTAWK